MTRGCERNGIGRPTRTVADAVPLAVTDRLACGAAQPSPRITERRRTTLTPRGRALLDLALLLLVLGLVGALERM